MKNELMQRLRLKYPPPPMVIVDGAEFRMSAQRC